MMIPAVAKSSRGEREGQSPFFRDLSTPVSARRSAGAGRFATPAQAAAVSALWRDNLASVDPPPPPAFTLGDRFDFSPEPAFAPSPTPPSPETRTPPHSFYAPASSPSPLKAGVDPSASGTAHDGGLRILRQPSFGESGFLSPGKSVGSGDRLGKGKGSPVDGVIQSGALITLPPPREVAMPEVRRNTSMPVAGDLDEEQWVTVYGFSLGDTNLVLREFEKCGVILKHILGPRDANWVHILYQSQYDARKALAKDGLQLNNVLIIGVKTVDPQQKQYLNQHFENNLNRGLIVPLPSESGGMNSSATSLIAPTSQNYFKQNIINSASCETGQRAIATPTKSVLSKVMDLMFSI
ncbi:nuclear pore complex protein NUP35-like [Zingiber officinale]|uniref:nuclear pore complex protein NUP35-like n=1 Tax=Zingiber officinale TaxID=94328 RepID=UPI001C4B6B3D|nr:nuclear pore complex protein NUP35-like [Zingiber officinale]